MAKHKLSGGKGSSKQTGKISNPGICRAVGTPVNTLFAWSKLPLTDHRRVLYKLLKNYPEDVLKEMVEDAMKNDA